MQYVEWTFALVGFVALAMVAAGAFIYTAHVPNRGR
jgi:hypothetical protein